ncbi:hypothetical protein BLS_002832 [Venturia inaequalis]|uniref:Chitin synthase export chaperone n=1 Tax=Venturia inaequalis TaxID=5025 RepID=A0A8H3VK39_VENIN|nr:hypothetical protein BLS_002832 [Venturia inaequalis]KAE9975022.1 hypothetical protein EG328_003498 [Venturia inaequalis]KAE9989836.1 hypothetical protein EG327_002177 [Venturia inaequalis]RDI87627.1 DNA-directed RNA polymerase III subunit [Venturia inaequalis]
MSAYGDWFDICKNSGNKFATFPVCNLFNGSPAGRANPGTHINNGNSFGDGCQLTGISLGDGRYLANLGSILLCALAIAVAILLILRSNVKKAAVGRREMQLFLLGYIIIDICEIFTIGGFPLDAAVRRGFSAAHIAAVVVTSWILLLNALVGFQFMEDGTAVSLGLMIASGAALFIGTGYIALDTGFSWTGYFDSTLEEPNQAYALYTLYQIVPLLFLVAFFLLEAFLVLRILGERRPMLYLLGSAILFAIGQIFNYTISQYICNGTNGKINGGLFETLFTLLAVIMVWIFWSSITEDDWPIPPAGEPAYR